MPALILMSLWGVGNTVVIYLAGLQDVPRELYEAAPTSTGRRAVRQLWHVTLPGLSQVIFFNLVMGLIGTLQVFAVPADHDARRARPAAAPTSSPCTSTTTPSPTCTWAYASAMAWVQLLAILALTGVAAWSGKRWVHT